MTESRSRSSEEVESTEPTHLTKGQWFYVQEPFDDTFTRATERFGIEGMENDLGFVVSHMIKRLEKRREFADSKMVVTLLTDFKFLFGAEKYRKDESFNAFRLLIGDVFAYLDGIASGWREYVLEQRDGLLYEKNGEPTEEGKLGFGLPKTYTTWIREKQAMAEHIERRTLAKEVWRAAGAKAKRR